jgi:hypothetical protein
MTEPIKTAGPRYHIGQRFQLRKKDLIFTIAAVRPLASYGHIIYELHTEDGMILYAAERELDINLQFPEP